MSRTAGSLVRDFFLAPERPGVVERAAPVPPVVVVLGETGPAAALACGAALALSGGTAGTACLWPGGAAPAWRAPATGAARRAARRLASRGCETVATGRLARVTLPEAPVDAAATVQRAVAAAEGAVAICLAGPRTPELDVLFTLADAILLARRPGDAPALTALAEAGLERLGVPVTTWEASVGPSARLLATCGLAVPAPARAALDRADLAHSRVVP
jgi:hypothetical protein